MACAAAPAKALRPGISGSAPLCRSCDPARTWHGPGRGSTGSAGPPRVDRSRRRAAKALSQGKRSKTAVEFTESLVDDLQVGVLVTGARSGIVRYVNATACEIVGRRPESVVGRPWRFLLPRPDGEIVHARVVAALTHAFAGLLGDDEPHLVYRLEEVTDREKIAYYLGLVLDNSLVSVGLVDRSGRVVYCTGGRTAEETMDILEAEQRPVFEVFAEYQETLSMLEPAFRGEASSKVVQGYGRYFDFHVVPITDAAGRVRLAAAISTDVTERERAHAGQARLAALAEQALVTREPVGLGQLDRFERDESLLRQGREPGLPRM